jgi:hypothetical protein
MNHHPKSTGNVETQISHHLESLAGLLHPLLAQSNEVEKLRKEVELWKNEWARAEGERKRLEGVLASGVGKIQSVSDISV